MNPSELLKNHYQHLNQHNRVNPRPVLFCFPELPHFYRTSCYLRSSKPTKQHKPHKIYWFNVTDIVNVSISVAVWILFLYYLDRRDILFVNTEFGSYVVLNEENGNCVLTCESHYIFVTSNLISCQYVTIYNIFMCGQRFNQTKAKNFLIL